MTRLFRVCKSWGMAGGQRHYSHASVMAEDEEDALLVAQQDGVEWMRIDTYDETDETYKRYEVLWEEE